MSSAANGDGPFTELPTGGLYSTLGTLAPHLGSLWSWQRAAALPGETHSTRDRRREVSSRCPASAGRRGCEDRCYRQTRRHESHCCKWSWSLPGWKLVLLCDVAERQPAGGSLLLPKYRARGLTHLSPRLLKMTVHSTLKTSVLEEIQIFFFFPLTSAKLNFMAILHQ